MRAAKSNIRKIDYKNTRNEVFIEGPFDPEKLLGKIVCRAGEVVKEIKILKKKEDDDEEEEEDDEDDEEDDDEDDEEDDEDEEDEEEPDAVEDEDSHVRLSQNERTATREEDGCHTSMASEGPWSLPALLEWSEASSHTPFSLRIPQDMTLGDDTALSATESHVLRLRTNPSMIQADCHDQVDGYPSACVKKYKTRDEASAPFFQQLDEGNEKPVIASHPKRTKCPFGYKDVLILVQATVIMILMWYLM